MAISNKKHHLTHADELYYGSVYYGPYASDQNRRGVLVSLPSRVLIGAPTVADADGVAASQSVTAGEAALINGALASGGVATFDVPRNVQAAWTTTAVATVTGTDKYGETLVESSASGTSMTGKKAFKTVTKVTFSANVTGATVGDGSLIGMPFRVNNKDEILIHEDGVVVASSTFAAAVTTDPATATTGDVRGTLACTMTFNGTRRLAVTFLALDPSSKESLFGVAQYGG